MHKQCHCEISPLENAFSRLEQIELQKFLRVAASPNRLKLLLLIDHFSHCIRDLVVDTGLSQTLVSHHLSDLLKVGLIEKQRMESVVSYMITEKGHELVEKLRELPAISKAASST